MAGPPPAVPWLAGGPRVERPGGQMDGPATIVGRSCLPALSGNPAPEWPGVAAILQRYHALTFGWILGEVVRRVDGRPVDRFAREEVGQPLSLEGQLYFGVPDAEAPRVATANLGPPPAVPPAPDAPTEQGLPTPLRHSLTRPDVGRACVPSLRARMPARAPARSYAALIGQGVDGVRLLTPERTATTTAPLPREPDVVFDIEATQGLGVFLGEGPTGGRLSTF